MFSTQRHTFTLSAPKRAWYPRLRPRRFRRFAGELAWIAGWFFLAFGAIAATSLGSGAEPVAAALLAPLRLGQ